MAFDHLFSTMYQGCRRSPTSVDATARAIMNDASISLLCDTTDWEVVKYTTEEASRVAGVP